MLLRKSYAFSTVFTLQSIKSRIETQMKVNYLPLQKEFLLYSPLNQGLKLPGRRIIANDMMVFTLQSIKSRIETGVSDDSEKYADCFYSTVH